MTTSNQNTPNPNQNTPKSEKETSTNRFLQISFILIITYLLLKLIILPITQTAINIIPNLSQPDKIKVENIKSPELSFPDILLLALIFLFQPQSAKIFDSLDLTSSGISAKFRELKAEVDEAKEAIDKQQEKQLIQIRELQQLMFPLILTHNEIKQLEGLKTHIRDKTPFKFNVYEPASQELRRLRDSKLIKVKTPYRYLRDIQEASEFGKKEIDLTQYCELTELGEQFLEQLARFSDAKPSNDSSSQEQ